MMRWVRGIQSYGSSRDEIRAGARNGALFLRALMIPALLALWPGAAVAQGADGHTYYYVAPGGDTGDASPGFSTIQAAVDAADDPGDVVKVAAGTYDVVETVDEFKQIVRINKSLTIRGGYTIDNWHESDPETNVVLLDAGGQGRGILFDGHGETVVIDGFQVTGGSSTAGMWLARYGGGIHIYDEFTGDGLMSDATIRNCRVYGNTAGTDGGGGGIYASGAATIIEDCVVENNNASPSGAGSGGGLWLGKNDKTLRSTVVRNNSAGSTSASAGGGLYLGVGLDSYETLIIEGNTFESNQASGDGGGAAFVENAFSGIDSVVITISGNAFVGNAARNGGGLLMQNNEFGLTFSLLDNEFRGNTASMSGGGAHMSYWLLPTADGNVFRGNTALNPGGALYVGLCGGTMDNTLFVDNSLTLENGRGAGLAIWRGGTSYAPLVRHATFANNRGPGTVSAIHTEDSLPTFLNTVIAFSDVGLLSTDEGLGSGALPVLTNTLFDTVPTHFAGLTATDIGTVNGSALFVDSTDVDIYARDYHIQAGSDARDTGSTSAVEFDIDKQPRPMGSFPDLGADEYGTASADVSIVMERQGGGIATAGARILVAAVIANSEGSDTAGAKSSFTITPQSAIDEIEMNAPYGTCTVNGNTAVCIMNRIAAGETKMITLAARTKSTYRGVVTIEGETLTRGATDTNLNNNTAEALSVNVDEGPPFSDVWVVKTGPAFAVPGQRITYDLLCRNGGVVAATDVWIEDALPAGVSYVSATGSPMVSSGTVRWSLGTLEPGASVSRSIVVDVASGLTNGTEVVNTATVSAETETDSWYENTASVMTRIFTGEAQLAIEKVAGNCRWFVEPDPMTGDPYGTLFQEFYIMMYHLSSELVAPGATHYTVTDTFPAALTYETNTVGERMTFAQNGNTLTWQSTSAMDVGGWNWISILGSSRNAQAGSTITNNARVDYTLETTESGSDEASANAVVPIMPPIITFPENGFVALNDAAELEVKGVAQPGVTVKVYEDEILKGEVIVGADGIWETAFSSGLHLAYTISVTAQASYGGQTSEMSRPSVVQQSRGWCPQRSYWEGTCKFGNLNGRYFKFRFRGEDGTFGTRPEIPGVYGWSDTEMHLYTLCAPAKATCDDVVYWEETPKPEDGRWRTIKITGGAHDFSIDFQCGALPGDDDDYHTGGVVLIDPDGYVYDVTAGFDTVLADAKATCMWYNEQWGGWVEWPAHMYEEQINPQTTGADGYFAFFTPPGFYYIHVTDKSGYQSWRSPVVQVINEIVHVNVPCTPEEDDSTHQITLTPGGLSDGTLTIKEGDTVEWVASVRPGTGAEVLKDLTENAVLRVVSGLDPESETDSFDSGMMAPGQTYRRCFLTEGSYAYSTGTGQDGTIIVQKAGATGDVNSDGKVDAIDVQTVINEALGIATGHDCDLNGDAATNAIDVQMVINAALGLR